jgi:hypothetical protein
MFQCEPNIASSEETYADSRQVGCDRDRGGERAASDWSHNLPASATPVPSVPSVLIAYLKAAHLSPLRSLAERVHGLMAQAAKGSGRLDSNYMFCATAIHSL